MEVEILKDALEIAREKTDIAAALIGKGAYPMKRITDTLNISRSNQYTRGKGKRGRYKPKPDDAYYLPLIRQITDCASAGIEWVGDFKRRMGGSGGRYLR